MTDNEQRHYDPDTLNRYYKPGSFIYPETVQAVEAMKSKWGNVRVQAALRAYRNDPSAESRHNRAKGMYQEFGYPTQEEYDLAHKLHSTTVKGKGAHMDSRRYYEIEYEKEHGMRSAKSAETEISEAESKAAAKINRSALEVLSNITEYIKALNANRDVMLTDEEKAEAVAKWRADQDYYEAKAEFNERLQELHKQRKPTAAAALRAKHPNFR